MSGIYLLASLLCMGVVGSMGAVMEGNYNVTAVCTTVKVGTQLGSIESCDYYYVCTANGPVQTSCQKGYSYNYKTQSCSPSAQVDCYYGVSNVCEGKTGDSWVPVVGTCNEWIYCKGDVNSGRGSCGSMIFNQTGQKCDYGTCNSSPSTDGSNLVNLCDVVPPGIYFGSTSDCKTYNYCYPDGRLASADCPTSAFVVSAGACGYNVGNNCDRVVENAVPNSCTTSGDTIADPNVCGSYLICSNSVYVSKSCPSGQYFNVPTKACVARQAATPVAGCNRCQGAGNPFVNAVDSKYCQTYYYCNKGVNGAVSTCPYGYYFNEAEQGCADDSGVVVYASQNGACAGAVVQPPTTAAPTTTSATTVSETTEITTTTTVDPNA